MIIEDLSFAYGDNRVLAGVSIDLTQPGLLTVLGPNGAGKSTLLSILAGLHTRYEGHCSFSGREVREWPRSLFAQKVTFVPQTVRLEFPLTVEELVIMGRAPHTTGLFDSARDREEACRAMELTDTLRFCARDVRSLSGGERQRVILAAALAQQPQVLLLDEPTTFLDLEHQVAIYAILRRLAANGATVIAATHDVNLAATYSDRMILLRAGTLRADGPPATVLTRETVAGVFNIRAEIHHTAAGAPWVVLS